MTQKAVQPSNTEFALLEVLYQQFPIIAAGNAVLTGANLVAYAGKLPSAMLSAYCIAIFALIAIRMFMLLVYRRGKPSLAGLRRHMRFIHVSSLTNGIIWGAWSYYVSATLPAADLLPMVVMQAGICAGVVSTSSASRLGLVLFVALALVPLSLHQALYGGTYGPVVAFVILLYLLTVVASSNRIYRTIYNSIELADKNQILADRLYHFSNTDGLTGIANRRLLDSSLDKMLNLYRRHKLVFSVLLIDVDDFKRFNDDKGHLAGDECLKTIAEVARAVFSRREDLVARFGGEEFVALLPGISAAEANEIAERFRQRVYDLKLSHSGATLQGRVTVSIGVADSRVVEDPTAARLLEAADQALYQAKNHGKNQVRRFNTD